MTPGGPYRITTNRDFDEYLDQFLTLAKSMGAFDRVRRAIEEIVGHLEFSPVTWGDPVRRLEALGLTVFHRITMHSQSSTPFTIPMGSCGGRVSIPFSTTR